jgi:TPR repeat protein
MQSNIKTGSILFDGWKVRKVIGEGSSGKVYLAENNGRKSAIKHIVIPDDGETDGKDAREVTDYYQPYVERIKREIEILQKLYGNPNVVSYMNHEIREIKDRGGWEILIRMDYWTSFKEHIETNGMKFIDVLTMGKHLCNALKECREKNIIHRDIKGNNILIDSERKLYKLSDFGASIILKNMTHGKTKTGTEEYMAPEIIRNEKYDYRVDMYSLGIVMYKLLNDNRLPFFKAGGNVEDREKALDSLRRGEELPPLNRWGERMDGFLRTACAFDPDNRYRTFEEMIKELDDIERNTDKNNLEFYCILPRRIEGERGSGETIPIVTDNIDNVTDQFNKGLKADSGKGGEQDRAEAVKWYKKAAEQGLASAQYNLGLKYDKGEGVEQDRTEAAKWYRKAAEQGLASAQYNLGLKYDKGEGVEQSKEKAVRWYRKAARQGFASAQCNLGYMYDIGEGVRQSKGEAIRLYRLAERNGSLISKNNIKGCGIEYKFAGWLSSMERRRTRKAAERGNANAQFNLGLLYYLGEGVEQDEEEAFHWYKKAAEQGNANAQCNLGYMYDLGEGVERNPEEAEKWYRKAAERGCTSAQFNLILINNSSKGRSVV